MKAYKIDLTDYPVPGLLTEEGTPAKYSMRDSLVNVLFHPGLELGPAQLLEQNEFAIRIRKHVGDTMLVSEEERRRLRVALECCRGLGQRDVEFVTRVMQAPQVEVKEGEESPSSALEGANEI
jgi:hypothetical protein